MTWQRFIIFPRSYLSIYVIAILIRKSKYNSYYYVRKKCLWDYIEYFRIFLGTRKRLLKASAKSWTLESLLASTYFIVQPV